MKKRARKSKWEKMVDQIGPGFERREKRLFEEKSVSAHQRLRDSLSRLHPEESDSALEQRFQALIIKMKKRQEAQAQRNLEKEQDRRRYLRELALQNTPPKNPRIGTK